MSHFYGNITNSARKTNATARAHKNTGLTVEAQSYEGKIVVHLYFDEATKKDCFKIYRKPHLSSINQDNFMIARGNLKDSKSIVTFFTNEELEKKARLYDKIKEAV